MTHPLLLERQSGSEEMSIMMGDSTTNAFGPGGRQMVLFMGNRRICNCDDTLDDPYAYPLLVQLLDEEGVGINGDSLWFEADDGSFEGANGFFCTTGTYLYMQDEDSVSGISLNPRYIFPDIPKDIVVSIEAWKDNSPWLTKFISLRCFHDNDSSGLQPPKCHETTDKINKDKEIPGDGYNDNDEIKTIKVEIDYAYISIDNVRSAISWMKDILVTAHLDTLDTLDFKIDDEITTFPLQISPEYLKQYLATYRTYHDRIHVIIGTWRADDPYWENPGECISYNLLAYGGLSHTECAHFASTDSSIAQAYLDSTGIIIYGVAMDSLRRHKYNLGQLHVSWYNMNKWIAHAMAHEIGHVLGLSSHHPKGVMDALVDYTTSYDNYNFFIDTLLNKNPHEDAMNTRDVLGIHTIDTHW